MYAVQPDYRFYNKSYTVVDTHTVSGTWTRYATTQEKRWGHTSWVTRGKLLLMGGYYSAALEMYSAATTEIVNSGRSFRLVNNS